MVEVKVPAGGESITEVMIAEWLKSEGDLVRQDEPLVTLETDKATMDLPAPVSGVLTRITKRTGETARVGEVIAELDEARVAAPAAPPAPREDEGRVAPGAAPPPPPRAERPRAMPAAQRLMAEHGVEPEAVTPTGPGGRILKEDVVRHLEVARAAEAQAPGPQPTEPRARPAEPRISEMRASETRPPETRPVEPRGVEPRPSEPRVVETRGRARRGAEAIAPAVVPRQPAGAREEEVVPMSMLRRRVAQRLVEAQQNAALLTTFNEIDMSAVMALRHAHQQAFQQRYKVKLGFMSFFVKATIEALKEIPELNAEIRGTDIVYRNYHDIGIAVGGGRGLVVPVLRDAERLSFAETEQAIADFARRAAANELTLEELQGGTFTISNGGVYGSMLSTPIVNPPQSGVLGLHIIQDRPVARDGQIVIRPMMYVALTYDHRVVDGREAVTFLRHVKTCVEEPARILLEI